MVRPIRFGSNLETSASNTFQVDPGERDSEEIQRRAIAEFDALVEVLRGADVEVCVIQDTAEPHTPDSIFPNNWVSFHGCGTIVTYPLLTPNRRDEIRADLIQQVEQSVGRKWSETIDLTGLVERGAFLEGTGSMVLDRVHRIAYACLSARTTAGGLAEFAERMNYELIVFRALDRGGSAIYHTNVVMGIGADFAVVCLESIEDETERSAVASRLEETGHELIEITRDQLHDFAGNCLALNSRGGESLVVFSRRALDSLSESQRARLLSHARLLSSPLDTIESVGGGSARCMLAELHLSRE